jgi:TonB family protein
MMVTQSVLEPVQALKKVTAIYPAIARSRRLSGTVTVIATITVDGKATDLKFVGGPPVFRDAAFEAVRQWLFKPAKLNGLPIKQDEQIKIYFAPN